MEQWEESCRQPVDVGVAGESMSMWSEEEEMRLTGKKNVSKGVSIVFFFVSV